MTQISSKERPVCLVVENLRLYRKLYPELKRRFNLSTVLLKYKYVGFNKKTRVFLEISNFFILFYRVGFYLNQQVIICFARKRHLSYLVFARLLKLFGIDCRVYLYGFYVQSWAFNSVLRKLMSVLFTENIAALVISKNDLNILTAIAPKSDFRYYPHCQRRRDPENLSQAELGDYVFAGGHTNRDYNTLLECADKMPNIKFVVVWSEFTRVQHSIPSNVKVYKNLKPKIFYKLLAKSKVVVVPLRQEGFSSGQTVAVEAMQFGKVTIYSNFENVSQYFEDGVTGIEYISGDATSLERAIKLVIDDEERISEIGQLAQKKFFSYFTKERLDNALLTHIEDFSKSD